jgi:hypothetical protein
MISAKQLHAEFEETLLRGLDIFLEQREDTGNLGAFTVTIEIDQLRALMRERARNLAQAYADRVLSEGEADKLHLEQQHKRLGKNHGRLVTGSTR